MTKNEIAFAEFVAKLAISCGLTGHVAARHGAEFVRLARALSRIGMSECNDNLPDAAISKRDLRKAQLYARVGALCIECGITRHEAQGNDPRGAAIKLALSGINGNDWGDPTLYCVPEGE